MSTVMSHTQSVNREDGTTGTNVSVLTAEPSKPSAKLRSAPGPDLNLLLRVVPSGKVWRWRLFSRVSASRVPRLVYGDPKRYPTAEEAATAGRAAIATAVARCTVSGTDGRRVRFAKSETGPQAKAS
jgi:hypothetical protein